MEHSFASLNRTELYQLCAHAGLKPLPSATREEMIALFAGELAPAVEAQHVIDTWRHGIAGFVLDHWKVLQNQVKCPIKSQDPRACFTCLDARVVSCIVNNPSNERLIQLHRK